MVHSEQKIEVTKKGVEKLQKDVTRYVCFPFAVFSSSRRRALFEFNVSPLRNTLAFQTTQIAEFEKQLELVTKSSKQQEEKLVRQAEQAGVSLNDAQANEYRDL